MTRLSRFVLAPHPNPFGEKHGFYTTSWDLTLVRDWATDGVLVKNYFTLPRSGRVPNSPNPTLGPDAYDTEAEILQLAGWPLAYTSQVRQEALYIYGGTGVVLRLRWQLRDLDEQTVRISRDKAIALHDAAMRDPSAVSEEERTRRDYFLGTPYVDIFAPPTVNVWDYLKPVFDFPADVPWSATLDYQFAGKPVWYINGNQLGGFGGGMLDAQTGKHIRFTRPNQNHGKGPGPVIPTPFIP